MHNVEIGDCFRKEEVWTSPRGKKYKVVDVGLRKAKLMPIAGGAWVKRDWDAVINWVRDPADNLGWEESR